jgi:hypothetical protein
MAVKRCSDGFLNAFEEQWNRKPVVNLTVLNKMFEDMASELQNYITYCSHQEDLRTVLRTAMYVLVHLWTIRLYNDAGALSKYKDTHK